VAAAVAALPACSSRWRPDGFEPVRVSQAVMGVESVDEGEGGDVSVEVGIRDSSADSNHGDVAPH
jgi:hypothetical protein